MSSELDTSPDLEAIEGEDDELAAERITLPKGVAFDDPLSPEIWMWLAAFSKATKGMRVYAENNRMLQKFINDAYVGLERLFAQVQEVSVAVREDRLLYGKDPVHVNADREEGVPFILYRNAFRRLTFVAGMTREELVNLMRAISTDYSYYADSGDDLVTSLWRLALPHLRYVTIDAIAIEAKTAKSDEERASIERIQGSIEGIVAAIYETSAAEDDLVAGVSISKEDLEALKEVRKEAEEDLDLLDHATARAITDVPRSDLEEVRNEVVDSREDLMHRLVQILTEVLIREQSSRESSSTLELMRQLYDSLVLSRSYAEVTDLVQILQESASDMSNVKQMHISRHLLTMFSHESRVTPLLNALNDGYRSTSVSETIALLRALGAGIVPILLASLETISSPAHRRLLCDLIVDLGVPTVVQLAEVAASAKWFVVRDILTMAQEHPLEAVTGLVADALKHEHPKVRSHAVALLREYGRGRADLLVAERLLDDDLDVRLAAIRVAAVRKSSEAKSTMEQIIASEELGEREPRELRMLMLSYATLAGTDAVVVLDRILNPGFFAGLVITEPQIAAAFALGSIGTENARISLQKGSRTLNTKVRDACRRALSQKPESSEELGLESTKRERHTDDDEPPEVPTEITKRPPQKQEADQRTTQVEPLPNRAPKNLPPKITTASKLDAAPAFVVRGEEPEEPVGPINVIHRSGPAVPRVQKPHHEKEEMPVNLPPAHAVEEMPSNLPPVPASEKKSALLRLPSDALISMPEEEAPEQSELQRSLPPDHPPVASEVPPQVRAFSSGSIPRPQETSQPVPMPEMLTQPEGHLPESEPVSEPKPEPVPGIPEAETPVDMPLPGGAPVSDGGAAAPVDPAAPEVDDLLAEYLDEPQPKPDHKPDQGWADDLVLDDEKGGVK